MMILLCKSKNNINVMYDPVGSHAATHIKDNPSLRLLLKEAIGAMDLLDGDIKTHVDVGRTIGVCDVVHVDDRDEIVYGVRKNREDDGLVPFTKSRGGDPCRTVAMHLVRQDDGSYVLMSAWIGIFGNDDDDEPFPESPDATLNSAPFWSERAFVYGSQEIIKGTETAIKPW
jgi:hypothetical protein